MLQLLVAQILFESECLWLQVSFIFIAEMALNIEPASYIENFLACKASPSEACFSFFCSLYNNFKLVVIGRGGNMIHLTTAAKTNFIDGSVEQT